MKLTLRPARCARRSRSCAAARRNRITPTSGWRPRKNAALADAGVNAADATFTEQKRDREDGVLVYDIDFYTATMKYEYEIDAFDRRGARKSEKRNNQTQTGANDIGLEAAKNAALADAGVNAADATFTEQKRDREDGVLVYDIDFYTATMKYEYEIDALTGAVRERKSKNQTTRRRRAQTTSGWRLRRTRRWRTQA